MDKPYPISENLSKRIPVMRFILMVLVVYIHSANTAGINYEYTTVLVQFPAWMEIFQEVLSRIVAAAAVPLFFLISSVLLYAKPFTWWGNVKKKAKTLLLPFIIWNTVWILVFLVAQHSSYLATYFSNPDKYVREYGILNWVQAYFPLQSSQVFAAHLWFLSDLFRLNLLASLLKKAADKAPVFTLGTAAVLWLCDVPLYVIRAESLFFFVAGLYVVRHGLGVEQADKMRWWDLLALYVAGIAAQVLLPQYQPILQRANILFGILVIIKLSQSLVASPVWGRWLAAVVPYSFVIYVCHEYVLTVAKKLCTLFLPRTSGMLMAAYLLLPVVIIALCILFGKLFSRFLPKLYALATGSR